MSWNKTFRNSLEQFSKEHWKDEAFYSKSLDESFAIDSESSETDIFQITWQALSHSYVSKALYHMERLTEKCESPIEEAMLMALCIICHEYADNVRYKVENHKFGDLEEGIDSFLIEPQAVIGKYRADFLLTYGGYIKNEINGEYEWNTRKLIIECDGHDFHEKTKEQAARDKKRDRELQAEGYKIFHFTGSEIWRDIFARAKEAIKMLIKDLGPVG